MDIMRAGIDGLPPSESGGSGGTSSEILMMGRMMGNRFRTCHEALFHGKVLLPPPPKGQPEVIDASGFFIYLSLRL